MGGFSTAAAWTLARACRMDVALGMCFFIAFFEQNWHIKPMSL
jgi:hypothetical protein